MILQSLGYKTDLLIHEFENRIQYRGDYIVVETPSNPTFFWGNLVIFDRPPLKGDFLKWPGIFAEEFSHQPLVRHCTIGWSSPTGDRGAADEFVAAGFSLEESVVLTATQVHEPTKANSKIEVRPLVSNEDWEAAIQNQLECRLETLKLEAYEPFKRKQMARYRRMSEAGLGHWYGGFIDGKLAAELGLFVQDGLARFQAVGTHPDFRRQGICGTLVWQAALHASQKLGAQAFVMVADEDYHAAKIYESVGFKPTERQVGVCRYPKEIWG